ncbi:MAG: MBL fold metallo-hydrolase [Candidatus Thermoplasmatota archaeon]|nr:MBL fold metallo-hydrolase [Candidatus Thermoplasmatota archaeon]MBS3789831.1 MBL fold metallo-hydrolase [Candidatus Thermoplasmatota archaeon]
MKVRWLGNAALEIFEKKHILIDPNFTVDPLKEPDMLLLTHEHEDHFSPEYYHSFEKDIEFYAPAFSLQKFDVEGIEVKQGDEIDGIKVLDSDCYGSDESVSYFYKGLLHAGDSAYFPEIEGVEAIFTACFPDYYEEYVSAFKRLEPEIVIPFHYDPKEGLEDAEGLAERMDNEGIPNKILEPGDSIDI